MERDTKKRKTDSKPSATLRFGAVALAFLIIGYETALFVDSASRRRVAAVKAVPDTVFVLDTQIAAKVLSRTGSRVRSSGGRVVTERSAAAVNGRPAARRSESKPFVFNPNTATLDELMALGFSEKQAASIVSYREKGGHFARKSDFAKSYVVSDQMFAKLEDYIDIPLLDINTADSTAFDALPGIGPFFASRMVSYRDELNGYSCIEQLMDIYRFDEEKFEGLKDLIYAGTEAYDSLDFWAMDEKMLARHPYVRARAVAHSIVLFRDNNPRQSWTIEALGKAGVLDEIQVRNLSRCRIKEP